MTGETETSILEFVDRDYQYGFVSPLDTDVAPKGLRKRLSGSFPRRSTNRSVATLPFFTATQARLKMSPRLRGGGHQRLSEGFRTTRSWLGLIAANLAAVGLLFDPREPSLFSRSARGCRHRGPRRDTRGVAAHAERVDLRSVLRSKRS